MCTALIEIHIVSHNHYKETNASHCATPTLVHKHPGNPSKLKRKY